MAEYPSIVLTNAGLDMIAESQSGQSLIFTKLKIGDGLLGENESISALNALKSPKLDIPIQGFLNQGNGQVRLRYLVDNSGVPVNQGFFAREVGVYAKIGESGEERLYAYTNGGNKVDWIPDKNTPMDAQIFDIFVLIGNAQNVTVVIDGSATYATVLDLEEHNTSLTAHADLLHLRKNSTAYAVGDCKRSPTLPSWAYLQCTVAGTTAATEPTWPMVGSTITDGTVTWAVRDMRQGTAIHNLVRLIDVGGGVAGLPAVDGSLIKNVVSGGGSGTNRWKKYSDGSMEQRGRIYLANGANLTFPLAFYDTDYSLVITEAKSDSWDTTKIWVYGTANKAVGSVTVNIYTISSDGTIAAATGTFDWIASGRWKA